MSTDGGFLQILAVQRKHNFDYLLHLVDDYSRARIKNIEEKNSLSEKMWVQTHKHFKMLKQFKIIIPMTQKGSSSGKMTMRAYTVDKVAMGAVYSFGKRCTPKLLFNNMMAINDSIEITVQFIQNSINFVSNLINTGKRICPFQIDMCIAVGAPGIVEYNASGGKNNQRKYINDDSDDDDDDDDDDDVGGGGNDNNKGDFVDCVGPIEDKLKKNMLKYKFSVQNLAKRRMFNDVYKDFVSEHKLQSTDNKTDYLHKKRLIIFVDRREKNDDEKCNIFM
eukprot:546214_1